MPAELFDRRAATPPLTAPRITPDAAFAARPRLLRLRDELVRAAKRLRPARWGEPAVFFFDLKRQDELEAARPTPPDRFAELSALIAAEMTGLLAAVEVRRVARAVDGLRVAALGLAPHSAAARQLAELLAVPDDEVFVALAPADRTGVRLHVRGAAEVAQLHRLITPALAGAPVTTEAGFQFFAPGALRADGSLPAGFAGCEHWLWPTQPLAAVPRIGGERVVLLAPVVVRASLDVEPRFPALKVESEMLQTLNPFQVADRLSRLVGQPVPPIPVTPDAPPVARAA
jgi:hypothetical protein